MVFNVGSGRTTGMASESLSISGNETEIRGVSTVGTGGFVQEVNTQRDRNMEGYNLIDWKGW